MYMYNNNMYMCMHMYMCMYMCMYMYVPAGYFPNCYHLEVGGRAQSRLDPLRVRRVPRLVSPSDDFRAPAPPRIGGTAAIIRSIHLYGVPHYGLSIHRRS